MAIPGTGSISFSQIQTEFGGANPISLSEYYAGGSYTIAGTSGTNGAVPGSGAVSISKYYGTRRINTNAKVIFGYGASGAPQSYNLASLVSNTGVVAADITVLGTGRRSLAAAGYGGDRAIFGHGILPTTPATNSSITNLVSNTGVIAGDTLGVGTARFGLAAAGYGGDRAIFGYGKSTSDLSMTNLVSNTGVVAGDTLGVGTARQGVAAAGYGGDRAIFGYGISGVFPAVVYALTNLVSNLGVVAGDTLGVGTTRHSSAAAGYGGDKVIFGYGASPGVVNITSLVSNLGVVAGDTAGVGTARYVLAAAGYGGDKAIFGFGETAITYLSMTNLVSNTGVVALDTAGVGNTRTRLAAATFG
jgi:hypothetical protein